MSFVTKLTSSRLKGQGFLTPVCPGSPRVSLTEVGQARYREIRAALERDGIAGDRIPELAIPIQQLTDMTLSPHEGFVLSRVNGTWDVKAIMKISPMKELEVLMIFDKFVKDGVIRLKAKKKK